MSLFYEDVDKLLDQVREQYHNLEGQTSDLQRRLLDFRKDEEIREAERARDYIAEHSLLTLSDRELAAERAFCRKHYELHTPHTRVSGSTYIYTLTATGLGTVIKIKCPVCNEEEDITDTENW